MEALVSVQAKRGAKWIVRWHGHANPGEGQNASQNKKQNEECVGGQFAQPFFPNVIWVAPDVLRLR